MSRNGSRRIFVAGAGGWGTALASLLAGKGYEVTLWSHEPEHAATMQSTRRNEDYLPGVTLPDSLTVTHALDAAAAAGTIVMVTPSKGVRETAGRLAGVHPPRETTVVSCTKGIERTTGRRMSEILAEILPGHPLVALSGPSHAEEVARRIPAAVTVGGRDSAATLAARDMFSTAEFRVYSTDDIVGMELGGALKNIFALAAGMGDGLGLGDNAKAALVTRSLAEMIRLGVRMGGRPETFQGLSGIGDLMVTCFSRHSRNRSFGERIGKGESPQQIEDSTRMVAEGVPTARSALECARRLGIDCPVIGMVNRILDGDIAPREAMRALMTRDLKPENAGAD